MGSVRSMQVPEAIVTTSDRYQPQQECRQGSIESCETGSDYGTVTASCMFCSCNCRQRLRFTGHAFASPASSRWHVVFPLV